MHIDTAVAHVRELTQPQAHALLTVIHLRRQLLIDQRNAVVSALVTVGAQVKVRDNLKEKHLRGLAGTVQSASGKHAAVLLDEPSTRTLAGVTGRHAIHLTEGQTRYLLDGMPVAALDALDVPAAFAELMTYLVSQASSTDLDTINTARQQRITTLATDLAAGDTIVIINVSPQFLQGLAGDVTEVDHAAGTCRVLLTEESTQRLRWQYSNRFPVPDDAVRHPLRLRTNHVLITSRS